MDKVGNYYSYIEGDLRFLYYPKTGMVKGSSTYATLLAIEHFAKRGFDIDWINPINNPLRQVLMVALPEHLSEEECVEKISLTTQEFKNQAEIDYQKAKDAVIINNVNRENGQVLKWGNVDRQLNQAKSKGRQAICDYANSFNIEDIRPERPYLIASTKSSDYLVKEVRRLLKKLFDEGKLVRYDKKYREEKHEMYKDYK